MTKIKQEGENGKVFVVYHRCPPETLPTPWWKIREEHRRIHRSLVLGERLEVRGMRGSREGKEG